MLMPVVISLLQAFISTCGSLIVGIVLALLFYHYKVPCKRLCLALAAMLSIMPCKIPALACLLWQVNGLVGIIISHMLLNIPCIFFQMYLAMEHMDVSLLWAAQDLGATSSYYWRTIVRHLLSPTICSIGLFIFILCFSSHSIPYLLASNSWQYTPDLLMSNLYQEKKYVYAFAYTAIRFFVIAPSIMFYYYIGSTQVYNKRYIVCEPHMIKQNNIVVIFALALFSLCLLPIAYLFFVCLRGNWLSVLKNIGNDCTTDLLGVSMITVVLNSLYIAAFSSFIIICIAGLLLWYIFRFSLAQKRSHWLTMLTIAPLLLGNVCIGMIFSCGVYYLTPLIALIGSHVLLYYPFAYRIMKAQLQLYNHEWTYAALNLGASSFHVFRSITMPFFSQALKKAWAIAFSLSLVEVGAGSVINDPSVMTLPKAIRIFKAYDMMQEVYLLSFFIMFVAAGLTYLTNVTFVWLGTFRWLTKHTRNAAPALLSKKP